MKIAHVLNLQIPVSNEEYSFIMSHKDDVNEHQLFGRDQVIAENLVRKGIYNRVNGVLKLTK